MGLHIGGPYYRRVNHPLIRTQQKIQQQQKKKDSRLNAERRTRGTWQFSQAITAPTPTFNTFVLAPPATLISLSTLTPPRALPIRHPGTENRSNVVGCSVYSLHDLVHDGLAVLHHRHPVPVRVVDLDPPRMLLDVPSQESHERASDVGAERRVGRGGRGGTVSNILHLCQIIYYRPFPQFMI